MTKEVNANSKDILISEDANTSFEGVLVEMRGKGSISNPHILDLIDECIKDMKNINFGLTSQDFITYDDIIFEEGDTIRTFGTMFLPDASSDDFKMVLNRHMFEEPDEAIKNTIYHELCHYVVDKIAIDKGIFYEKYPGKWYMNTNHYGARNYKGHGSMWQYIANRVSNALGIKISRTDSYETHTGVGAHAEDNYKYIVKCKHCGRVFKYTKRTAFIKSIFDNEGHSNDWYCICDDGTKCHDFEIVKGK